MKKKSVVVIVGIFIVSFQMRSVAQQHQSPVETTNIEPYKISVSFNKTSNLIFPNAIKSVDRGSAVILVQKARGVENILQLKAAQQGFAPTNLSVITGEGKFYSFIVDYANEPFPINLNFTKDTTTAFLSENLLDEVVLAESADKVKEQPKFLHKKAKEQKMKLVLQSIYLSDNAMWFNLNLANQSLIKYTPDYVRFFIRDRKRSRRTAVQESKIKPIYSLQPSFVNGNEALNFIYGFTPFTLPASQDLIMEVTEKNGGRALKLRINHKILLKARLLDN